MKKRMMVLLLTAAMGMTMMGCQYGGDADAKSEQEETKKEETKRSEEKSGLSGTVTLAAAASLEYAFEEELIPAFEELYPKVTIEGVCMIPQGSYSSRSSPVLRQISSFQRLRPR